MSAKIGDVADKSFDYVIIGGGAAGLVLAARLSEDPSKTVCVLEAGDSNINDPAILTPASYGSHFGNKQYDWNSATTKQKFCSDRVFPLAHGRGLGGSTSINFMGWTKPSADEIDDWGRLGNPGWNWKNFQKYVQRAERFVEPATKLRKDANIPLNEGDLGTKGSVAISFPRTFADVDPFLMQTTKNAGIPTAPRPYGGNPNGCYWMINSLDQQTSTRSYACTAYYVPNRDRPNLTVLTGANVARVVSDKGTDGILTVTGVEFLHGEKGHVVHVNKEALVCAGALKSPQILELSGIGSKSVLEKAGVEVKIDLPSVGENMQEHLFGPCMWELKPEHKFLNYSELQHSAGRARHEALYKDLEGVFTMGIVNCSFNPLETIAGTPRAQEIYERARAQVDALDAARTPAGLREQYAIQLERLRPGVLPAGLGCETIGVPGTMGAPATEGRSYFSLMYSMTHPFSRGHVHITSSDPMVEPEIDPQYFEYGSDLDVIVEIAKFVRNIVQHAPLKDMIEKEVMPGPAVQDGEQFKGTFPFAFPRHIDIDVWHTEFVKTACGTTWHTCGTCSMTPRDKSGVVDHELKVYGTNNLRVVDLSIVPLTVASHMQSVAYAIAEQAADIIKGTFRP
ncbi:uncharacterized protein PHACADRAFT_206161 [Phanerochaete carnosa HHB-10118-sp]|uniref:Glucose-methanol-choline oxidoreductase N-terminal domain-containing protein n=1 Tax=Phanerochaete carnosa (strain HHB-10118-sp) TaxID=650164 RepID=K5W7M1_PHACS|nr:uncharacterized protein PHACADRAFT_206161 [Phanerochaete carnosa HHB-10118-sp]EKM59943.1 hypothetical protein PHACADRAFT_206161 [Phanerochaete carnosa HHB-10118-sp]